MSGVFQRMISRATGARTEGLRPRLPARFETSIDDGGFAEHQPEVPAAQSVDETQNRQIEPTPSPDTPAQPSIAQAEAPQAHAPTPPEPLQPAAPKRPAIEEAGQATVQREARVPPALMPTRGEDGPERSPPQQAPVAQAQRSRPVESNSLPTPLNETSQPPAPLLPPDPVAPRVAEITEVEPADQTTLPPLQHREAASVEPEITIHIGQLDLRTKQVTPPKPRPRQAPARSLPSLSDYLRGNST